MKIAKIFATVMLMASTMNVYSAINPRAAKILKNQIVNLNLEIAKNNNIVRSEIVVPFYQNAEFEKQIGNQTYLIILNPKMSASGEQVLVSMKMINVKDKTVFMNQQFQLRPNANSTIFASGMSVKLKSELI